MFDFGIFAWRTRHSLQELRAQYFARFSVGALIGEAAVCLALAVFVAFGRLPGGRYAD